VDVFGSGFWSIACLYADSIFSFFFIILFFTTTHLLYATSKMCIRTLVCVFVEKFSVGNAPLMSLIHCTMWSLGQHLLNWRRGIFSIIGFLFTLSLSSYKEVTRHELQGLGHLSSLKEWKGTFTFFSLTEANVRDLVSHKQTSCKYLWHIFFFRMEQIVDLLPWNVQATGNMDSAG
jgi:hypothetical protein